eukprot:880472_1
MASQCSCIIFWSAVLCPTLPHWNSHERAYFRFLVAASARTKQRIKSLLFLAVWTKLSASSEVIRPPRIQLNIRHAITTMCWGRCIELHHYLDVNLVHIDGILLIFIDI